MPPSGQIRTKKMENRFENRLSFVLRHYQKGRLDTGKAIRAFRETVTGNRSGHTSFDLKRVIAAVSVAAASVVAAVFILKETSGRDWIESASADASKTVILPDSTSVILAPNSTISYRKGNRFAANRKVEMSGKAFFSVTKDSRHPFEVSAGDSYIKVLGTEFQIDRKQESTEVYVQSGKVFFSKNEEGRGLVLTKGDAAVLEAQSEEPQMQAPETLNPAVWATGLFEYDSTPVSEVLDELEAFYGLKLELYGDPEKKLSGKFFADDARTVISLIEEALDIRIKITSPNLGARTN